MEFISLCTCIHVNLIHDQKSASRLRELLELGHVVDYLASCSGSEGSQRRRQRSSVGVASSGITWAGLWSSVVEYVGKEGDAISKLEEKGSGSSSAAAYTNRQNKKKVRIGAKNVTLMFPNLHVNVYITHAHTHNYALTCCVLRMLLKW